MLNGIIDIHTHAFPDAVAEKAIPALESEAVIEAKSDGKIRSLRASMDAAGVRTAVVASIATKPEQFRPILDWSRGIRSDRLLPFPSVHPDDPDAARHLEEITAAGFKGIKLHPYYQGFVIDEEKMFPFYERLSSSGLILLLHNGFDIAFPLDRIADPEKTARVISAFPDLKLITSHFGGWKDWEESEKYLLGKPVYMDISASLEFMPDDQARRFLERHPEEYLLFGSDWPWDDQRELLGKLSRFNLPESRLEALLSGNARGLLDLDETPRN
jgi:uncharacterized protein